LLSTADGRPLALLRQIIVVMVRGVAAHLRNPSPANHGIGAVRVGWALFASLLRHIWQILIRPSTSALEPGSL
jgi:hypothetical protein